jgi:arabinan endo-1,5-alpha-L-arabinosidase
LRIAVLIACAALAACSTVGERSPVYVNPVLARDFPDPAVLRMPDGWIYAYATQTPAPQGILNIQVARSRDLVRWEHLGDALPRKPAWASATQNFWAPHVIADGRRFIMYYSAEPDGSKDKCLAVATAIAPEGPFEDGGAPLLCGQGVEHIDPMAFDDPRTGQRLLYWGSGRKPLKVQPLAEDRTRFLPGSAPREILFPDGRDYRSLIEGAWLVHRAGRYYLFYSGDRCCSQNPRYAVMVARADDPLGPFEDRPEPILAPGPGWVAPGHNSVIADDAGQDWIVYHAARPGGDWAPRLMLIDRIVWRDGWPRIEGDRPSSVPTPGPAFAPD